MQTNLVNLQKNQSLNGRHQTVFQNEKEMKTLIPAVRICCEDIGIESGIEKCAMLLMKSGNRQMKKEVELSNQEKIKTFGETETYKYLGILEADAIRDERKKNT